MEINSYTHPVWLTNNVNYGKLFEMVTKTPVVKNNLDAMSTDLTSQLINLKNQFNSFQYQNVHSAHTKINPFEKIGSLIFQNRAAVKLLNINADTGYLFNRTNFKLQTDEIFYFADLCGGNKNFQLAL